MPGKKEPRLSGAVLQVRKHVYEGDGSRDHHDEDRCQWCGLRRGHAVHRLEPVDPEVSEATHRITGEREVGV